MEEFLAKFSEYAWGSHLLILLLGGGLFFLFYSRFLPFQYFGHGIAILRGKYDDHDDPGDISHYQALAGALAATVGVGNISGVAIAITTGGPGAVFWMWLSAFLGIATKFFTCTLAIMYRGKDSKGEVQGGPMYVITEGLGKKWKPLAILFSVSAVIGCFPLLQANQLAEVVRNEILIPNAWITEDIFYTNLMIGLGIMLLVSFVIFGGIQRIGKVAASFVPLMVVIYMLCVFYILGVNYGNIPNAFSLIITDAFSGKAILGGALGVLIITGVKRAAFSNEAGIGTAPMMHGAAKTKEPVREGLVAMLGPAIDTLLICTLTALAILVTNAWQPKIDTALAPIITLEAQEKEVEQTGKKEKIIEVNMTLEQSNHAKDVILLVKEKSLKIQADAETHLATKKEDIFIDFEISKIDNPENLKLILKEENLANSIPIIIKSKKDKDGKEIPNQFIIKENRALGVTITADAFNQAMPNIGSYVLVICIAIFAFSTLFSYSYYGTKCVNYLFGAEYAHLYNYAYIISIAVGAVIKVSAVINLIDGMYAIMAIPTMLSALLLSPKVMQEAKRYFKKQNL